MSFFSKDRLKGLADSARQGLEKAQAQVQDLQRRTSSREGPSGGPAPWWLGQNYEQQRGLSQGRRCTLLVPLPTKDLSTPLIQPCRVWRWAAATAATA